MKSPSGKTNHQNLSSSVRTAVQDFAHGSIVVAQDSATWFERGYWALASHVTIRRLNCARFRLNPCRPCLARFLRRQLPCHDLEVITHHSQGHGHADATAMTP